MKVESVQDGNGEAAPGKVLVLNSSYQPLNTVNVRRAVILVLKKKAEIVERDGAYLRSENLSLPVPLVIRLAYFVHVPQKGIPLSRRAVFARDNHTCQYCGGRAESIDHVVPRSRGGKHEWENVVAACRRCNTRKMNRLPHEAGLRLLRKPFRPKGYVWLYGVEGGIPRAWEPYLDSALVG
jgi:5-methylcytosine-specific restriction endonuclease McrA